MEIAFNMNSGMPEGKESVEGISDNGIKNRQDIRTILAPYPACFKIIYSGK